MTGRAFARTVGGAAIAALITIITIAIIIVIIIWAYEDVGHFFAFAKWPMLVVRLEQRWVLPP